MTLPLRYRLRLAGVGIDVHAEPEADLADFADRARDFARSQAEPADEVLEIRVGEGVRRDDPSVVYPYFEGGLAELDKEPGRARGWMSRLVPRPFENFLRVLLSRRLVQRGGVLMHSAALTDDDGRAWLFPGPSGAGKSTLTLRHPSEQRIAEDLVAVTREGDQWKVHSLPFHAFNRLDIGRRCHPLRAVAFLRQTAEVAVRRLPRSRALPLLSRCVVSFGCEGIEAQLLDRLLELVESVPMLELSTNRTSPIWPSLQAELRT